jgi:hypothetical protein
MKMRYRLLTGLLGTLLLLAATLHFPAKAQVEGDEIEMGSGLICDTAEQVALFIALAEEHKPATLDAAVDAVNKEVKDDTACVITEVFFIRRGIVREVETSEGRKAILAVDVVGVRGMLGPTWVKPTRYYGVTRAPDRGKKT